MKMTTRIDKIIAGAARSTAKIWFSQGATTPWDDQCDLGQGDIDHLKKRIRRDPTPEEDKFFYQVFRSHHDRLVMAERERLGLSEDEDGIV